MASIFPAVTCIPDRQSKRTGTPHALCRNALFRALSVATQKSLPPVNITDRAGRLPEHAAPVLPTVPVSVLRRAPSCVPYP
jgi:hypothetical protein